MNQGSLAGLDRLRAVRAPRTRKVYGRPAVLAAAIGWALSAAAQTAPERAATDAALDDIVVSATRIARPDFVAPTPLLTVTAAEIEQRGATNITNVLQQLPAIRPFNSLANTGAATSGIASVDLRGLGPNRTLLLINGRRIVPSSNDGFADLNAIPSVAIGRVEVVTGGASAAWGSDAVAGVVNLMYDTSYEGVKVEAQIGDSFESDAQETKLALSFGRAFGERGRFLVAAEWNKSDDLVTQQDRDWGRRGYGVIPNPANVTATDGIPRLLISPNIQLTGATYGGLITGPASVANTAFGPGGSLLTFARGSTAGGLTMIGGTNSIGLNTTSIAQPYDRKSALASVTYDLTDRLAFFMDTLYSRTNVENPIIPTFNFSNITIRSDNPFIPTALATQLAANNITQFTMGRINRDFGVYGGVNRRTMFSIAAGLRGDLGSRFTWDAYYQYGESLTDTQQINNFYTPNFALAVDAVTNPATGQPACRATLNPGTVPAAFAPFLAGCQPLNLFGEGSPSAAALNYIKTTSFANRQQRQTVAAANLRGDIVDLWAGPLSIATGVEYRDETLDAQSDPASLANILSLSNARPPRGDYDVLDVYAEAVLPLLKDVPFARSLELNAAVRRSDYSTVGDVNTWKVGLTWAPLESLLVRGALSRDIRAPNLNELFAPGSTSQFTPNDPCSAANQALNPAFAANCAAQGIPSTFVPGPGSVTVTQTGNDRLEPEKGTTTTVGIVYTPEFLSGFTTSIDWYNIELKGAIGLLQPATLLLSCYQAGVSTACDTINRDPTTRSITGIRRSFINVGAVDLSGVDFQVSYATDLLGGNLGVRLVGSNLYTKKETVSGVDTFQIAGQVDPTPQAISTGVPKWRANLSVDYEIGGVGIRPRLRYMGSAKFNNSYGVEDININSVKSVSYVDLTIDYAWELFGAETVAYIGGNNLTNVDPPVAPNSQFFPLPTNVNLYELIGRTYFAGLRMRF